MPTRDAGPRRDACALRIRIEVGRASRNAQLGIRFSRACNDNQSEEAYQGLHKSRQALGLDVPRLEGGCADQEGCEVDGQQNAKRLADLRPGYGLDINVVPAAEVVGQ